MKQVFNPFLPLNKYIADGEAHVFDNRVYLFGSHDSEGGESYCLEDYEVWSAPLDNLKDWTCPGISYSVKQDPLYNEKMCYGYAPDVVRGNDGKFYMYYCLSGWKGRGGYTGPISVAVCDTPDGKYEYLGCVHHPDGRPYLDYVCFDPAVINDDGTIRIYFGTGPYRNLQIRPWNAFLLKMIYEKIYGKPASSFTQKPGPLGANVAVIADDMLTLKELPKRIEIQNCKHHAFFEGSSIRKWNGIYYFVYSSEKNHELCYATSRYPDKDFVFKGILVSNGDVGINGRKEKQRANTTGTTHGEIERINNEWYIFYHRLTHGSDYSRQSCAEKLQLLPNGEFQQAEMTSCGLNDKDLLGFGKYPAIICCHLTNGHMPHVSNRKVSKLPMITHEGQTRYIANARKGTSVIYKYFDLQTTNKITLKARGKGIVNILIQGVSQGSIEFNSDTWCQRELTLRKGSLHNVLSFKILEGSLDLLDFQLYSNESQI